jgi:uncharacterized membrane protein YGL010W
MESAVNRPVDRWFDAYSADHQHPTNQLLHVLCVPAIVWSVMALLYAIPLGGMLPVGIVAFVAALGTALFWCRLSWLLGLGATALLLASLWSIEALRQQFGIAVLVWSAIAVFVIAWIGQFIGHYYEGKRPSFFTDLVYLLVGPIWVLGKLYRRLSIAI